MEMSQLPRKLCDPKRQHVKRVGHHITQNMAKLGHHINRQKLNSIERCALLKHGLGAMCLA